MRPTGKFKEELDQWSPRVKAIMDETECDLLDAIDKVLDEIESLDVNHPVV